MRWTLSRLNAMDREQFTAALGWVFEGSPWVAERAWQHRPFRSLAELHEAMCTAVRSASREEQLALIRAHPELGTRRPLSGASAGEQASAGLDRLGERERAELLALGQAYRERFGFPFVMAVRGRTSAEILEALRRRLEGDAEGELRRALAEIEGIARFRLEEAVAEREGER